MKPLMGIDSLVPAARREPARNGDTTPHGVDLPPVLVAGVREPASAAEVDTIADLLHRPPTQDRSQAIACR